MSSGHSRLGAALVALVAVAEALAQFAPLPEAESPEEFDDYVNVVEAATPGEQIHAAETFIRSWRESALRGPVYARLFEAYRRQGDGERAIEAAENALKHAPDNLAVLAELALVLANGTRDGRRLARAAEAARRVLALTETLRLPKSIPPAEWESLSARLKSQAHAALGLVANARGDPSTAIGEFETAVTLAPVANAAHHYRLGLLYRAAGRRDDAIRQLGCAAMLGEPAIAALARQELEAMGVRRSQNSPGAVASSDPPVTRER
jgi:tetratricopeptide (TPR) repeat protein